MAIVLREVLRIENRFLRFLGVVAYIHNSRRNQLRFSGVVHRHCRMKINTVSEEG
jgi:hypothetical protein